MSAVASRHLIVPRFGRLYRACAPWTEAAIRVAAGLSLVPHGYPKLLNPKRSGQFFAGEGFEPGLLWAVLVGCTEVFGGLCLAIGLFTRIACVPILLFLLTAVAHHWPNGFSWIDEGFEYPLFWAVVVFHVLIHGGGPHSVDGILGREV